MATTKTKKEQHETLITKMEKMQKKLSTSAEQVASLEGKYLAKKEAEKIARLEFDLAKTKLDLFRSENNIKA